MTFAGIDVCSVPLGVRDPAAESVVVYEELLAAAEDSPWILNHLARDEV